MSDSRQNLLIRADVVKNETEVAENTANRIGGILEDIVSGM